MLVLLGKSILTLDGEYNLTTSLVKGQWILGLPTFFPIVVKDQKVQNTCLYLWTLKALIFLTVKFF